VVTSDDHRTRHPGSPLGQPAPRATVTVPTKVLVAVGTAAWSVALVVTLLVPSLHTGDRSWWPWTCVAGIALGACGWWYVARGKGNAAGA
jgi:hypothetical protein